MAFEHVEALDVRRRETLDHRAADAVFFLGEIASEELLAPFSRNNGGVIRTLDERNTFIRYEYGFSPRRTAGGGDGRPLP